jgi:hypothetical protein
MLTSQPPTQQLYLIYFYLIYQTMLMFTLQIIPKLSELIYLEVMILLHLLLVSHLRHLDSDLDFGHKLLSLLLKVVHHCL